VIRGKKHFTLLPPIDSWCLKGNIPGVFVADLHLNLPAECYYPHASYKRDASGELMIAPSDASVPDVRWSSITDPDDPTAFPGIVQPIKITLHAGETLYLPVGWWHHVRQTGLTMAVNWWYDAELRGMTWVMLNVLRNQLQVPLANESNVA
jgi:jumonji domain-containing protein 7